MAAIARRLPQRQQNPYNALQSSLSSLVLWNNASGTFQDIVSRTFQNNALYSDGEDPDPAFKPYNRRPKNLTAPLKTSQNPAEPTIGHNNKKEKPKNNGNEPPGQARWSLDEQNKTPLHSSLTFDFYYSYSETNPHLNPLGFREKKFSPFGPGRIDRTWTGWYAPAPPEVRDKSDEYRKRREEILGEPLSEEEVAELVEKYSRGNCNRQINLGRDGVTHNMLDDIHNHWKRAEAVRIKCLGVPTIDMENIRFHLEDKTGGKIISRRTNILILYRGRHYDPKQRPVIPLMLWKPCEPIFPKLIKNVVDGLTFEETKELRNRGLNTPALTRLTKNGCYVHLVQKVRDAFVQNEVVRIDCTGMETSDYKKIGAKLRDLVPSVLLLFKDEQILIWRGKNYDCTVASYGEGISNFHSEVSNG